MRCKFLLFNLLLVISCNSYAQSCTVIANLQATQNLNEVEVLRDMYPLPIKAGARDVELCADDVVAMPESLTQTVTLHYYSHDLQHQVLNAGEQHMVVALESPCGDWCQISKETKRLYLTLTRKRVTPPKRIVATDRGDSEELPVSTLVTGHNQPLYLFSNEGEIGFFWNGGKKPYKFLVQDQQGKTLVSQSKLHKKHTSFTLPSTEPNQTYKLILKDKSNQILETDIVFRLPPFPLNPEENKLLRLTRLLLDPDNNWRLEVWRQLQTFKENPKVHKFKAHLLVNDF